MINDFINGAMLGILIGNGQSFYVKKHHIKIFSIGNLYDRKTSFTFAQNFPQEYISCGAKKRRNIMDRLKNVLRNNRLTVIGSVAGGVGGYLYWLKVGCTTGACPITSSPVMSVVWGAAMGILVFNLFKTERRKR
jgi:hypothetical protein